MGMIEQYAGPILIVTGTLTALIGTGFLIPRLLLRIVLGLETPDPTTVMIARHWTLVVGLIGGLLIYAGYHPEVRVPVMIAGAAEKLALGALVIASPLRRRLVTMLVVCADATMAVLYLLILAR
jgi:hypothetical protein